MYDSAYPAEIPDRLGVEVVAGYDDGRYAWTAADWALFPNARQVHIAALPSTNSGQVLDCELGDATPQDCPSWIRLRQAHGLAIPTIYCARSAVPAVQKYCKNLTYDLWVADWTGVPHIPAGAAACQYAAKGSYDVSLCEPYWPRA